MYAGVDGALIFCFLGLFSFEREREIPREAEYRLIFKCFLIFSSSPFLVEEWMYGGQV